MDIGSNISNLIQSAIKTKLIELNAYVDDELPDYIMIMIANKKPEDQMFEALSLFLSDQAGDFTKWLYQLLTSLKEGGDKEKIVQDSLKPKEVTKAHSPVKSADNSDDKKALSRWDVKNKHNSAGKRKATSSEAVIEIANETDDFFDQEILECENLSKPKKDSKDKRDVPRKSVVKEKPRKVSTTSDEVSTSKKSKKHSRKRKSDNFTEKTPENKNTKRKNEGKESTEQPKKHKKKLKRKKQESEKIEEKKISPIVVYDREKDFPTQPPETKTVRKRKQSNDDDVVVVHKKLSSAVTLPKLYKESIYISDDSDNEVEIVSKSVVSKVAKVRQTTRLPANKQASKNLLLKAVSEAEISVRKSRLMRQNQQDSKPHTVNRNQMNDDVIKTTKVVGLGAIRKHLNIEKRVEKVQKRTPEKVEIKTRHSNEVVKENGEESLVNQRDSRRIICREATNETGRRKLVRNIQSVSNIVQFDSRKAESRNRQTNDKLEKEEIVEKATSKKERSVSPCFVVTLDGEVTKNENKKKNGLEPKKQTFKPVTIEAPMSTSIKTISQKSPTVVDEVKTKFESSDAELSAMRAQLIKMQEETRKLKSHQDDLQKKSAAISALHELKTETKSIHVANVHFSATEKQLSEHFSVCGKVLRTTIIKDAFTGISKGFAYLEFEETNSIDMALALDSTPFCSRIIKVSKKDGHSSATVPTVYRPHSFYPAIRYRSRFLTRKPKYMPPTRFFAKNKTWVKSDHVKM